MAFVENSYSVLIHNLGILEEKFGSYQSKLVQTETVDHSYTINTPLTLPIPERRKHWNSSIMQANISSSNCSHAGSPGVTNPLHLTDELFICDLLRC